VNAVRTEFERYSEPLLRVVGDALVKPRNKLPIEELLEKCLATLENATAVDRRIRELPHGSRAALIAASRSGQPLWTAGQLIAIAASVGQADGFQTVLTLLTNGLIVPAPGRLPIPDFDAWFAATGGLQAACVIPGTVRKRAAAITYDWPVLSSSAWTGPPAIVDRLDIPLRLAAVRQRVESEAVRLTKTGTLYKKDHTRFDGDPVFAAPGITDAGLLSLFWAYAAGLLARDGETLSAAPFPEDWHRSTEELTAGLFAASFRMSVWRPLTGAIADPPGEPAAVATAGLLTAILLSAVPENHGVPIDQLADWLWEHHPSWPSIVPTEHARNRGIAWVEGWLTAIAVPLGIAEFANNAARLTPLGRSILDGTPVKSDLPAFPTSLLVQPNGELIAYRQGLSADLIRTLSRFARWKVIGPACTLELTVDQVYRGLESGLSVAEILQTLQKHGSRAVPPAVEDLIRRCGSKRERVTVFAAATLVEFMTSADLDQAIGRGLVSIRLTDRIGLTADGRDPDYAGFRLTGNRDYEARQQPCLQVGSDGVTWTVDPTFADLLLDVELHRISRPILDESGAVRAFAADPAKLRTLAERAPGSEELERWFMNRTGQPMPAAVRLFINGPNSPSPSIRTERIIRFADEIMCDGICQWPDTVRLIRERLGPTSVVVDEERLHELRETLKSIGVAMTE
jgi:hypothetical protein